MKTQVINYLLDMYPELDFDYVSGLVNQKYDSIVKLHNKTNDKYSIVTELTIDMVAMLLTADMLREGVSLVLIEPLPLYRRFSKNLQHYQF